MAKALFLAPYSEVCETARRLESEYSNFSIMSAEYVTTEKVEECLRRVEENGCDLVIARGVYAQMVRQMSDLPLVELKTSVQELGRTIKAIKAENGGKSPKIALVALANTICDTTYFNELFEADMKVYAVGETRELEAAAVKAKADGCSLIIGGNSVCKLARQLGVEARFLPSGEESIREVFETANRVAYAVDLEKRNSAEIDTMLNYTFNGIMQLDASGTVRRVNHVLLRMLKAVGETILGRSISDVIPAIKQKMINEAFSSEEDMRSVVIDINKRMFIVSIVPIFVEGKPDGVVLTFQEDQNVQKLDSELRYEIYKRGYVAKYTFDSFVSLNRRMQSTLDQIKRVSKFPTPILLVGDHGTGKDMLAQCIHNESLGRSNAFITLDCSAYQPEVIDNLIFGNYTTRKDTAASMAELAQNGTLYLKNIEALPLETQYKVCKLIRGEFLHNGVNLPTSISLRIIASTTVNLVSRVESDAFRSDLYYILSVLNFEIEPLRKRKEDILGWMDFYMDEWERVYHRHVQLSQGARAFAEKYDWPGNLNQISTTCERILLLTERRSISEDFLRRQIEQVVPKQQSVSDKAAVYRDPKAEELTELLKKHGGSREKVAAELGVSKTTLWRYMKKYGISSDFSY